MLTAEKEVRFFIILIDTRLQGRVAAATLKAGAVVDVALHTDPLHEKHTFTTIVTLLLASRSAWGI